LAEAAQPYPQIFEALRDDEFEILDVDESVIPENVWQDVLRPGQLVRLELVVNADGSRQDYSDETSTAPVILQLPRGRRFRIPFQLCKTWTAAENMINSALSNGGYVKPPRSNNVHLLLSDGSIILPEVWASAVRPGLIVNIVSGTGELDLKNRPSNLYGRDFGQLRMLHTGWTSPHDRDCTVSPHHIDVRPRFKDPGKSGTNTYFHIPMK